MRGVFLPGNRTPCFRKPPVLGFCPRSYGLKPRHAQGTVLLFKCRPGPDHACYPLKHGSLCTRASGMPCSCGRQGRPSRSNPNTRHARVECRLDRQHSISVSPRSPSVPGRSLPHAGYQITLAVEAAGIWALKHRPSGRALQIPEMPAAARRRPSCSSHIIQFTSSPSLRDGQGQEVRLVRASTRWQE